MTTYKRVFDLEMRMTVFAKNMRDFCMHLDQTQANRIYIDQLIRASSSVGANYIEGNDALGRKDFIMKIKTSRREARETRYWLQLIILSSHSDAQMQKAFVDEAEQFIRILSAIILKVEK